MRKGLLCKWWRAFAVFEEFTVGGEVLVVDDGADGTRRESRRWRSVTST